MDEQKVKDLIQKMIDDDNTSNQFAVAQTPFHTHNGADSSLLKFTNLRDVPSSYNGYAGCSLVVNSTENKLEFTPAPAVVTTYILFKVIGPSTNQATGTSVGGNLEMPFTGTITEIGAYVDTAGTTGTATYDVNKGGTTIMSSTKITIDSTEISSRTAATQPVLTTTSVTAGDLITVDVDAIQTTPAKGLTIRLGLTRI